MSMTYAGAGVNYEPVDMYKREAQKAASETDGCLERLGFAVVPWSRGESVFLIETPWAYLGLVVEGLGTKSLVADAVLLNELALRVSTEGVRSYYANVAQCNAAMAFNDMITLGVSPIAYSQYLAVRNSEWFGDERRCRELIAGTRAACLLARCPWGGGETPALNGIIVPGTADLAGATMGIVKPKSRVINPANIRHGDAIILIGSSGIHANGLTLARKIADQLPEGYQTELSDGRTYGATLLDPTHIYVRLVEECLDAGVEIHAAVNITGHGLRKLMRATEPFTYVIKRVPKPLPVFDFIQNRGPVDDREMYGTFNMGAGFALYVPENEALKVIVIAESLGFDAWRAGYIENGDKKVVIETKGIEFAADTLGVR